MKRPRFLCAAGLVWVAVIPFSVAQPPQGHEEHGSAAPKGDSATQKSDHMMMGMMSDATHQKAMVVFLLPELQPELGLSTQQIADLRKMKLDLTSKTKEMTAEAKNKELDATLLQMKAALTEEQRNKLAAMTPMRIHELAMARVPMAEHRTMAGFRTPGDQGSRMMKGGMMKGGMMKGGMMKGGMMKDDMMKKKDAEQR